MQKLRNVIRQILNEQMVVNKKGEIRILYPYDKIKKFVDWFQEEYKDYTQKQGWAIFDSDTEHPNEKYQSQRMFNGKLLSGYYWQVQKLDSPGEGEALFGELENDYKADNLAIKLGLMIDEYGVVYGWNGQSFLDE